MNTAEPRLLRVEVVADLPLLCATCQPLDLPAILDRHFPAPLHWKATLTPGEVLAVWLLVVVSPEDHCLNHIQPWGVLHHGTLSALLGQSVLPTHAHDDRLADTANCYATVLSEQGLLPFGHGTDHPDRPPFKIAAAVLDALGLPLVTAVVPGNAADDPLYIPAIQSMQQSFGVGGRT